MNIAIITNMNGIGLQREYEMLREFLLAEGHGVTGVQYDAEEIDSARYDLAIFLEVVPRNLLGLAERRWIFVNPEWTTKEMIELIDRSFEKVFAKTREAERICEPLFPGRVHFTGFLCRDQYDKNIPRVPVFLHLAGNSIIRGTQEVLDAWRWKRNGKRLDARLIVVGTAKFDRTGLEDSDQIVFMDRVDEEELKRLQNMCMYHLLPSGTEGFGHALHEALSVGAAVITTGAPPMNEIKNATFLPSEKAGKYNLADIYQVNALDIYHAVQFVTQDDSAHMLALLLDRTEFLEGNEVFVKEMRKHLGSSVKKIERARRTDGRKAIAFIGNFEAHESTENMVRWALEERLNVKVELLQENKITLGAIKEACDWNDALLWIRTPGWLQVSDGDMLRLLEDLKKRQIPTISMHLDKFWGIPSREKKIGFEPFWMTDMVWTADGSRQDDFFSRGVNHFWMRPAVSEVYCHPGKPFDHLRCDVAFVGAKDYHAEYPFRRKLVEWLEQTYGERFKHVTNVRGHELNDVYASAKVVVGDCIFAGTPCYWSDRVPETVGRYGFLLHPTVMELSPFIVMMYEPQNLDDLEYTIERALAFTDHERKQFTIDAAAIVRAEDTWTIRMKTILENIL